MTYSQKGLTHKGQTKTSIQTDRLQDIEKCNFRAEKFFQNLIFEIYPGLFSVVAVMPFNWLL